MFILFDSPWFSLLPLLLFHGHFSVASEKVMVLIWSLFLTCPWDLYACLYHVCSVWLYVFVFVHMSQNMGCYFLFLSWFPYSHPSFSSQVSGQEDFSHQLYQRKLQAPLWPSSLGITDCCQYVTSCHPKRSGEHMSHSWLAVSSCPFWEKAGVSTTRKSVIPHFS